MMGAKETYLGESQRAKARKSGSGAAVGVPKRWLHGTVKSTLVKLPKKQGGENHGKTDEKD